MLELFIDKHDRKEPDQAQFSILMQDFSSDNESQLSRRRKISIKLIMQHHAKDQLFYNFDNK